MVTKKKTKRRSKKISKGKNNSISKKDFEAFKFGVDRLKELKSELDSLDTRGFAKEEQAIRSKLKKVSEIPNIERGIKDLKKKIHGKYKPKKRKAPSTKKILDEGLEDIQEEIKKLKTSKARGTIDSGVDVLVDTNFNQFLNSTKQALSQRIRKKEEDIDDVLKSDLEKRDEKYKKKNNNLIRDFENKKRKLENSFERKYKQKVESDLHKEVADKFNKMLKDKLQKEKVELSKEYRKQLKEHSDIVLKNKQDELENKFNKKKERFEKYEENEKRRMGTKILEETHKKVESEMERKEKILRKQLRSEYDLRLKKQIQDHEAEIKKRKLDLELEMQKKIKQLLN